MILDKLNLPHLIAGEAGKALSRLVGEGLDYPSAWIQRYTQGVKDGTEARSVVNKAIADAVARKISDDPAVIERAANSFLARELRKQTNKEAVAEKTIELLEHQPITPEPAPETPEKPSIDDDWLNVFEKYAEDASTERLQDLWAKILAGEIRKPKSFSLKTLRFVAELDQDVARTFERYSDAIVSRHFIPTQRGLKGKPFTDLLQMQDAELIAGVGANLTNTYTLKSAPIPFMYPQNRFVVVEGDQGVDVKIPCVLLTKVGREIYGLLNPIFNDKRADEFAEIIPKKGLNRISLGGLPLDATSGSISTLRVLWQKDQPSAQEN